MDSRTFEIISLQRQFVEITDDTITLRAFKLDDTEEHLAGEDEQLIKWLNGGKSTPEGVKDWIQRNQRYRENDGPILNFAIIDTREQKLVGMVEANTDHNSIEGLNEGDANISYGLYPFARGKGYATRAVNLMTNFLKDKRLNRAVIRVDPANEDSLKVPLRCGFKGTGTTTMKSEGNLVIFVKNLR